jgi:hypothetical protein
MTGCRSAVADENGHLRIWLRGVGCDGRTQAGGVRCDDRMALADVTTGCRLGEGGSDDRLQAEES